MIKITDGIVRNPEWRMSVPVNLEICDGEQIAICGDNAAGKTRLVEIITGHYPLLQDQVRFNFDTRVSHVDRETGVRRMVSEQVRYITFRDSYGEQDGGYYLQQRWNRHSVDDDMPTVGHVLAAVPERRPGMRDRIYRTFGIRELLEKQILSLSSGELRKLQLAKTLLADPKVLIVDNPFIGLDAGMRTMLQDLLAKITRETTLQVILVVSRHQEIPPFITHVIEVKDMTVQPKVTRQAYLSSKIPSQTVIPHVTSVVPQTYGKKDPVLVFHHVTIRYGSHTILEDLDWTVRQGECWAVSGENGAGKSTLLSLVCADNPQAYACDIELFGSRRGTGESIWDIKRRIGYVSPEMHRAYVKDIPAVDIVASGLHDSIGLYRRTRPDQRQQCLHWMEQFGIQAIADRSFLKLSSGEQRLCLLARAFVKDPELLVLDEPMHGLDTANREKVREIIGKFCRRPGKTMIMVTHYEDELPDCITDRLLLKKTV